MMVITRRETSVTRILYVLVIYVCMCIDAGARTLCASPLTMDSGHIPLSFSKTYFSTRSDVIYRKYVTSGVETRYFYIYKTHWSIKGVSALHTSQMSDTFLKPFI